MEQPIFNTNSADLSLGAKNFSGIHKNSQKNTLTYSVRSPDLEFYLNY
jgi:hypothetical protein